MLRQSLSLLDDEDDDEDEDDEERGRGAAVGATVACSGGGALS